MSANAATVRRRRPAQLQLRSRGGRERESNGDDACVTAQPRLDRNLPNGKCDKAAVVVVAASAAATAAAAANHRN